MDQCIFCDVPLAPGSEEHVFLAALGGRVATRRATCNQCNNAFASDAKVDDSLAKSFLIARCGLMIWSGRGNPPPTIQDAGVLENGPPYDLAPGFVPVLRPAKIPPLGAIANSATISAKNEADVKRIMNVVQARGEPIRLEKVQRVQQQVPLAELHMSIPGPAVYRSLAKTALTAACVLYGNRVVREHSDVMLRAASRTGAPDISSFVGWDYVNQWPHEVAYLPHRDGAEAVTSGFEHSVLFCDVEDDWVAYVELFGKFRFSVWLGQASGLPTKGIAVNPRAGADSRMRVHATPPATYRRRKTSSFRDEHPTVLAGVNEAMAAIMHRATTEAREAWFVSLAEDLGQKIAEASNDIAANEALISWSEKVAAIHVGGRWEETLDSMFIDEVDVGSVQPGNAPDGDKR